MFLICSFGLLCSFHEPSILTCPQAPAGHGALRAGGCTFSLSRTRGGDRARAAAWPRRAIQRISGRFEAEARVAFDDGWQSLDDLPRVQDHGRARYRAQGHHPQQLARHRLRPLHQPLPGLRAWLRLLFCAADPRLSRPVARARLRIEAVCQTRRAAAAGKRTGGAGLRTAHDRDRHQHRSLSADRARAENHARHSRSAGTNPAIRSASSPNRRW